MGEREADLAIVAGPSGSVMAGCRGGRRGRGRALRKDRQRVMVLGEQHRLKDNRKNAEQRRRAPQSRHPRLVHPERCG